MLAGLKWTTCLAYLDDIFIYSKDIDEHVSRLAVVLTCLRKAKFKIKLKNADTLGHIVSVAGIGPDPEKVRRPGIS